MCLSSDLANSSSLLLSQNHDLESLEVSELRSSLSLSQLLSPRGGSPLGVNVSSSPLLGDSGSSGTSWQVWQHDWGQHNLVERDSLSLDSWTINQNLYVSTELRNTVLSWWPMTFHADNLLGYILSSGR